MVMCATGADGKVEPGPWDFGSKEEGLGVEGFRGALAFGFKEEGLGFRGCRGFRV